MIVLLQKKKKKRLLFLAKYKGGTCVNLNDKNDILFSICPHDTAKGLEFWHRFKKDLEEKLGEPIEFEPFRSFEEEEQELNNKVYHLYYASFVRAIELYQNKGYKPIAKFKGQKDEYYIVAKDPSIFEKNKVRFAITFNEGISYYTMTLSFEDMELVYAKNYEEVLELLIKNEVDVGFMYNETWEQIEDTKKKNLKILKTSNVSFYHIFMAHPEVYDKLRPALLSFDNLEEIKEEDLLKLKHDYKKFLIGIKRLEESEIAKAISLAQNVGIIIYQDKIVFANEYAKSLLGYDEEELYQIHIFDTIGEEQRELVKTAVERRLKREFSNQSYEEISMVNKSGEIIITHAVTSMIIFKGKPSNMIMFVDITKQKRFEKLYAILKDVNQAITRSTLEEEMFSNIAKSLVDKFNFKLVWIGYPDENSDYFKIDYKFGEAVSYLETKIPYKEYPGEGIGPGGTAYREDRVVILPNIDISFFNLWRDKAKKYGLKSVATIPIKVDGVPKYVIGIYSGDPGFFNEDITDVLKEIKSNIEFGVERLHSIRQSIILEHVIEASPAWVLVTDEHFKTVYVNDAVSRISLYEKQEIIGQNPRILKSGLNPKEFYEELYNAIINKRVFQGIVINKKKNGELFYLDDTIYAVEISPGVIRYVSIGRDITKELELTDEIIKLKNQDILTGLLSLEGFKEELPLHLKENEQSFLALIDIYNFTAVNKLYGIDIGNRVLKEMSNRLKHIFEDAILSRISSDEFGIFKSGNEGKILSYIAKIKDVFKEPIKLNNIEIPISFNAGIAFYPKDGNSFKTLHENASISLRQAKQRGENTVVYFSKDIETKLEQVSFANTLIDRAFRENLFILYYQPVFDTKILKIAGFEALIRIKDKDGIIYTPNIFIDFLENSKYIFDFEKWLVQKVSQKSMEWDIPISFNISAKSFQNEEHMKYLVSFSTNNIMETTERLLLENTEKVKHILDYIKETTAFKIAIDDFGTEYSSLKYIKDLPIDEIKIDISFVKSMMQNEKDMALVETIIHLSKRLGFKTLAEGVETQDQLQALKDMGCDYVQGFLLGKPKPEEEAEELIKLSHKNSNNI